MDANCRRIPSGICNLGICTTQTAIRESAQRRQQFGNLPSADSNSGICTAQTAIWESAEVTERRWPQRATVMICFTTLCSWPDLASYPGSWWAERKEPGILLFAHARNYTLLNTCSGKSGRGSVILRSLLTTVPNQVFFLEM